MSGFPANSNLYLDDDAVVRSTGIHEPRKEKLKSLKHKIRLAWRAEAYDQIFKQLSELEQLNDGLPQQFEEVRRLLPLRQYIAKLKQAKKYAERYYQAGVYAKAHYATLIDPIPAFAKNCLEESDQIDLLIGVLASLREKSAHAWVSSSKQEIDKLIAAATAGSLSEARKKVTAFEKLPIDHAEMVFLQRAFSGRIRTADRERILALMNEATQKRLWRQAVEFATQVLGLDSDCSKAKDALRTAKKAILKRKLLIAGAVCIAVSSVIISVKVHRDNWRKDFYKALNAGQYEVALRQAKAIKSYEAKADEYIRFSELLKQCQSEQSRAARIQGIQGVPLWDHWKARVAAADQKAWLLAPHSTEDKLAAAHAYYNQLRSYFSGFKTLMQNCQSAQNQASRIVGVQADPEWAKWKTFLSSAQSKWIKEGSASAVVKEVSRATAYYDALVRRAVSARLNVSPPMSQVVISLSSNPDDPVFEGSVAECATRKILPADYLVKVVCDKYHPASALLKKKRMSRAYTGYGFWVELKPFDGRLRIDSAVRAEVWSASLKIGSTGKWIPVPAEKTMDLKVKALGYEQSSFSVRTAAGEEVRKTVELELATGVLRVSVVAEDKRFAPFLPTRGMLSIDNLKAVEISFPHRVELLPEKHEIKLTVSGFEVVGSNTAIIEIDKVEYTGFKLRPVNSSIVFTTNIKNDKVKIYANDKYLGRAGEEVFLQPFLKHAIRLTARGYKDEYWNGTLPVPGRKHSDILIEMDNPLPTFGQRLSDGLNKWLDEL